MNEKDFPTVLWCLLVVLLFFLALLHNHCYSQMEWARKRESTSCFARRLSFFPAPCMGACLQAKKEIGTGTDRTGRLSWERTKELLQRVSGR